MTNNELPIPFENVMVFYKKDNVVKSGEGFYSDIFNTFSIPPEWREFNGNRLPHGWGGVHLKPEEILKWEPLNNES